MLKLNHGLSIADLYRQQDLARLDGVFLDQLERSTSALHARLVAARAAPQAIDAADESALIIELAPHLEAFVVDLFGVAPAAQALAQQHTELSVLYEVKRKFVQRQAAKAITPEQAQSIDGPALLALLAPHLSEPFDELVFARRVVAWQANGSAAANLLETARQYAAWAVHTAQGRHQHRDGVLFKRPSAVDPMELVPAANKVESDGVTTYRIDPTHLRRRDGFALTDPGTDLRGALDQSNYCILCHTQKRDSCSTGLREKPSPERRRA